MVERWDSSDRVVKGALEWTGGWKEVLEEEEEEEEEVEKIEIFRRIDGEKVE